MLPLRSEFVQRIVSHVEKMRILSEATATNDTNLYISATIRPRDHAEPVGSRSMFRSGSAERMTKPKAAAVWEEWIRRTDPWPWKRESTGYGVKLWIVERKGCLRKDWKKNVPNHGGAQG